MPPFIRESAKDGIRIGAYAAKQPLSGTNIVTKISVKGCNGTACFCNAEETKRAG